MTKNVDYRTECSTPKPKKPDGRMIHVVHLKDFFSFFLIYMNVNKKCLLSVK